MSSGRLFRVAGPVVEAVDESALPRRSQPAPAAAATRQPEAVHEPSLPSTAYGPRGSSFTLQLADLRRRLPVLEAWALEWEGIDARIWEVWHWDDSHGVLGGMVHAPLDRPVIYLNQVSPLARCPVTRLAVIAHEAAHVRRGDTRLGVRGGFNAEAEADCERAAEERIVEVTAMVDRKLPAGSVIDPKPCQQCYRDGRGQCRQSADVLDRVQRGLRLYDGR